MSGSDGLMFLSSAMLSSTRACPLTRPCDLPLWARQAGPYCSQPINKQDMEGMPPGPGQGAGEPNWTTGQVQSTRAHPRRQCCSALNLKPSKPFQIGGE